MSKYQEILGQKPTEEELHKYYRIRRYLMLDAIDDALKDAGYDNGIADINEEDADDMFEHMDYKVRSVIEDEQLDISRRYEERRVRNEEWQNFVDELLSELRVR